MPSSVSDHQHPAVQILPITSPFLK